MKRETSFFFCLFSHASSSGSFPPLPVNYGFSGVGVGWGLVSTAHLQIYNHLLDFHHEKGHNPFVGLEGRRKKTGVVVLGSGYLKIPLFLAKELIIKREMVRPTLWLKRTQTFLEGGNSN